MPCLPTSVITQPRRERRAHPSVTSSKVKSTAPLLTTALGVGGSGGGGGGRGAVIINQHKENKVEGPAHSKLAREEISISEKKEKKKNPSITLESCLGFGPKITV